MSKTLSKMNHEETNVSTLPNAFHFKPRNVNVTNKRQEVGYHFESITHSFCSLGWSFFLRSSSQVAGSIMRAERENSRRQSNAV